MKQILVATDFSDSCMDALRYTISLIKNTSIKVDLLHVYDIPVIVASSMPQSAINHMMEERERNTLQHLKQLQEEIPVKNQGKLYAVYGPYPASDISHTAEETNADLIVMAQRQKYSLLEKMLGTITAHTIALSKAPVLTVPSGCSFSGIHKILFPTSMHVNEDLSAEEEKALQWLYDFWSIFGFPAVHLLHVEKEGDLEQQRADITYKHRPFSETDFTVSQAESLEEGIKSFIDKEKAELIAFYKPHRSFWERLYHSSLTRKLLFKSRTPMLIFS